MTKRRGKRYEDAAATLEEDAALDPGEALSRVRALASAGFDETVEVAVRLNVDPRKADEVVRSTVVLPAGTGREIRVLVLARGAKAADAEEAGADFVGTEYMERIEAEGWLEFDIAIATPDLMREVAKLGRILGPRGLMPTPKAGTVTDDVGEAVKEAKAGKIEFRVDRHGNIHAPVGKAGFSTEELELNFTALMDEIIRQRPAAAKAPYIRSVTVSSTMGPGVSIDPHLFGRH